MPRSWTPMPVAGVPDDLILFDGVCVLCSRAVRFVAARDNGRYRLTAVQSPLGQGLAGTLGIDPENPQTNAVVSGGVAYLKSDAALTVLGTLPGWRWARWLRLLPRPLRDGAYDLVARNRYRLFGRTDACMVPPPGLRARVLDNTPG